MKKLLILLIALMLAGTAAYADGPSVEVAIPVENEGLEGLYVLEMDGKTVDRIKLPAKSRGVLKVTLDRLDDYELAVWQMPPNAQDDVIYDDSFYKLRVTVLLSDEGEPTYFFSAEKEGEDGKAARVSFLNYRPEKESPKTGDENDMGLYLAMAAVSAAGLIACLFWVRKKSRA